MAKEETVELEGVVNEVLPNTVFRVQLENQHEITAYASREDAQAPYSHTRR